MYTKVVSDYWVWLVWWDARHSRVKSKTSPLNNRPQGGQWSIGRAFITGAVVKSMCSRHNYYKRTHTRWRQLHKASECQYRAPARAPSSWPLYSSRTTCVCHKDSHRPRIMLAFQGKPHRYCMQIIDRALEWWFTSNPDAKSNRSHHQSRQFARVSALSARCYTFIQLITVTPHHTNV